MTKAHHFPGQLISFEGIEAAGKSTQIKLLSSYFQQKKTEVLTLREPGGTAFGELLRECLLAPKTEAPSALSQALTFIAARAELLEKKVVPWLSSPHQVVLLDRFIDSTLAYQGIGQNLGIQEVLDLHRVGPLGLRPDLTIYLKISWPECQRRMKERSQLKDFFEGQDGSFHQSLIRAFDHLAGLFPERIVVIDAEDSVENIHQKILNIIQAHPRFQHG